MIFKINKIKRRHSSQSVRKSREGTPKFPFPAHMIGIVYKASSLKRKYDIKRMNRPEFLLNGRWVSVFKTELKSSTEVEEVKKAIESVVKQLGKPFRVYLFRSQTNENEYFVVIEIFYFTYDGVMKPLPDHVVRKYGTLHSKSIISKISSQSGKRFKEALPTELSVEQLRYLYLSDVKTDYILFDNTPKFEEFAYDTYTFGIMEEEEEKEGEKSTGSPIIQRVPERSPIVTVGGEEVESTIRMIKPQIPSPQQPSPELPRPTPEFPVGEEFMRKIEGLIEKEEVVPVPRQIESMILTDFDLVNLSEQNNFDGQLLQSLNALDHIMYGNALIEAIKQLEEEGFMLLPFARTVDNNIVYFPFDPQFKVASHTLIVGMTGSGKSYSMRVLLEELLLSGAGIIMIAGDPDTIKYALALKEMLEKSDYVKERAQVKPKVRLITLDILQDEFPFFDEYVKLPPESFSFKIFGEAVSVIRGTRSRQTGAVQEVVFQTLVAPFVKRYLNVGNQEMKTMYDYVKYISSLDIETLKQIVNTFSTIKLPDNSPREKTLESIYFELVVSSFNDDLRLLLTSFGFGKTFDKNFILKLFEPYTLNIIYVPIEKGTIYNLIGYVFLIELFNNLQEQVEKYRFAGFTNPVVVSIDEAHNYLSVESKMFFKALYPDFERQFYKVIKEIRKNGVVIVISTQSPSDIKNKAILEQFGNIIIGKIAQQSETPKELGFPDEIINFLKNMKKKHQLMFKTFYTGTKFLLVRARKSIVDGFNGFDKPEIPKEEVEKVKEKVMETIIRKNESNEIKKEE